MNRCFITLTLVFAIVFGALAPDLARAQNLAVFTDSSSAIHIGHNSYFLIALAANPTTGYSWSSKGFSRSGIVQVIGSGFISPNAKLLGAGGTYVYLLKAIDLGTTTLTLTYTRPFESAGGTIQTFQITVVP